MKSLRFKILAPLLALVLVGFMVVSISQYISARKILVQDIEQIASDKAEKLSHNLNQDLEDAVFTVELLASTDTVRSMDWPRIKNYFDNHKELFSQYDMFSIADTEGHAVNTQNGNPYVADRDWWSEGMKGKASITEPIISRTMNVPIIMISTPIKDNGGKIVGVFSASIQLGKLSQNINAEKFGTSGYAFMIDKKGLVLAHPDAKAILEKSLLKSDSTSLVDVVKKMVSGETGVGYYEMDGVKKVAAYAPLQVTDWVVAVSTDYNEVAKDIGALTTNIVVIGLIVILALILIVGVIVNRLLKPIVQVADLTNEVAAGNLKVGIHVANEDEVGTLANNFNRMIEEMKNLLSEMKRTGLTVASSSQEMVASSGEAAKVAEQIAATVSELARGASEQSDSALKGSSMVKEVVVGLSQINHSTASTEKLTKKAMEAVAEGVTKIHYQKNQMDKSKEVSAKVSQAVADLSEKSKKIGQIVEVINGISDQTNLLALNAAIEAARAGESGRGFSVVADEVRKLAEQSKESTLEINALIEEIVFGTEQVVSEMEKAEHTIKDQETAVNQTAVSFDEIMRAVSEVTGQIKEVSRATEVLSRNAVVVDESINTIAASTRENAAGTQETAAAIEEQTASIQQVASSAGTLADLAYRLQRIIDKFNV